MDTVLMVDTWVAALVAAYVAFLAFRGVVPWVPHALGGIIVAFLVPVVGPIAILGAGIWLQVRHRATR